jgi:hypothetical protein
MDGWGTFCSIWVRGAGAAVRRSGLTQISAEGEI